MAVKVLLIKPQSDAIGFTDMVLGEPLGLEMVAGALRDHDVRILDLRLLNDLPSVLSSFKPDLCGISCSYTIDTYPALSIAQKIKKFIPNVFVFIGGHHASLNPGDFATNAVDAVVIGEGEQTSRELVEGFEKKGDLKRIAGLVLNGGNGQIHTPTRPLVKDLDSLPFPQRNKKAKDGYHLGFQTPFAMLETSRGCIYRCAFCSVWQFYRRRYREKSPERVIEELKGIKKPYIFFVDDNFLVDVPRAKKIANMIKDEGIKKTYTFQARSDTIAKHPETIRLWKDIGLKGVFIGFEKIDDEGLRSIHKNNKAENNEKALKLLKDLNLVIYAAFIIDPDYGREDFQKLKEYITSHKIKNPSFSILTPLPGTELFYKLRDKILTEDYNLYDIAHAVLPTKLPLQDFYEEFCSLYWLPYSKYQLILEGFGAWLRRRFSLPTLFTMMFSARRLANPKSYLIAHNNLNNHQLPPSPTALKNISVS